MGWLKLQTPTQDSAYSTISALYRSVSKEELSKLSHLRLESFQAEWSNYSVLQDILPGLTGQVLA